MQLVVKEKKMKNTYQVDEKGYYGPFGGSFVPEMLYPNVEELKQKYLAFIADESSNVSNNDISDLQS